MTAVALASQQDKRWGINSRVVAAGSQFYVFTPSLLDGAQFQPKAISYYFQSGGTWVGPTLLMQFASPENNSPSGTTPIYYAPLIDASGNASGTWAVTYQFKNGGYNNVAVCTNNPSGCYVINPNTDDEFMNGVSVGPEGGIWTSYLTYSSVSSRQLPLYHQTIYLKPGQGTAGALGATGNYNVDPTSWYSINTADRCSAPCLAAGDYARIASNPYLGLDSPYIDRSPISGNNDLFQIFAFDPQGSAPKNTFTPKPVYYPIGSDLRSLGTPNPPETLGIAPEQRRKMPGKNGH